MAVTSTELHWKGATGSHSRDGREYTAVWRAYTDNPLDQAAVVLAYFQVTSTLPYYGSAYSYGNDSDATAFCDSITPNRAEGIATIWEVVCHFKSSTIKQENNVDGVDQNGNPTNNPLDFRPTVRCSTALYQEAVSQATYLEGFIGQAAALTPAGKLMAPCNSAFEIFSDPPLERDRSRLALTITRNVASFDIGFAQLHIDKINKTFFTINFLGIQGVVLKHCAKITSISEDMRRETISTRNGAIPIEYLEVTYELHINPDGWNPKVLDQGRNLRAMEGDADQRGGVISASDIILNPTTGKPALPQLQKPKDFDDHVLNNPNKLNGDGAPLPAGDPEVFITYRVYEEILFTGIPQFAGIFQ